MSFDYTKQQVVDAFNQLFSKQDWIDLLTTIGWKPHQINGDFPTFTRQGKDNGASGELIMNSNVILFHNFSDNSNLPRKNNGKSTFSPAEVITHFYFNNNWRISFKFFVEFLDYRANSQNIKGKIIRNLPSKQNSTSLKKRYLFSNVVKDLIHNQEQERLYRLSFNTSILNKNLNPITSKPYSNYSALTTKFVNVKMTDLELATCIGKGFSICCSILKNDEDGNFYRKCENWAGAELIGIDIDNGLTIEECLKLELTKYALLLYTTASHSSQNHRYRLILELPYYETDKERLKYIIGEFINHYKADRKAGSVVTAFYGNSNASIYLIKSKLFLKFQNGILINSHCLDSHKLSREFSDMSPNVFVDLLPEDSPKLFQNWCEVICVKEGKYYVKDRTVEDLKLFYKEFGKIGKKIRPIHYDDNTNKLTYLDMINY